MPCWSSTRIATARKEAMTIERCEIRRCRAEADITYLDHGVCDRHWIQLTAEDAPPDALRIALGIAATAPTATEDSTMARTKQKTKEKEPKKEKAPQVVFAFRLSEADRTLIHKAAGPAKATRFVLGAALAAATGNTKAFGELTAQAKINLK